MRTAVIVGAIVVLGGLTYPMWPTFNPSVPPAADPTTANTALVEVSIPADTSQNAQVGKLAFDAKCSTCHGTNAAGQDGVAPPLIHKIYEPSHHGDESFQQAAANGVRAHHWPFGNMPAVEGLTRGDVKMIVAYIRELQRANGIN